MSHFFKLKDRCSQVHVDVYLLIGNDCKLNQHVPFGGSFATKGLAVSSCILDNFSVS